MRIGEARCLMNLMMRISFASALLSDVLRSPRLRTVETGHGSRLCCGWQLVS